MKYKSRIIKSKNYETALKEAESVFGVPNERLNINYISKPKKILGITLAPAVIEASVKPEACGKDINGEFFFDYRTDGVYLLLIHPSGNGKPISEDEVAESIFNKNIQEVDFSSIGEALVLKKKEVLIAPSQEKVKIDERIEITVVSDDMEAYIIFYPPDGGKVRSFDEIVSYIAENGVLFGINYDVIKNVSENRIYGKKVKFAEGRQPENGRDAEIKYILNLTTSNKPKHLNDGSVDYYEIENYINVSEGDVIAQYVKPVLGIDGCTVKGKTIKAYDGQEIKLPLGDQVQLAENGVDIIACVDGIAEIKGDKICVSNSLIIDGDVDVSTGNIKFYGNIKIMGNVLSSLSVTADGSIEIDGYVEAAAITAKGNIKIKRGVTGGKNSIIKAGGSVYADFLENTIVQAEKGVYSNSIIHSEVESGDSIIVSGYKGIIYGGKLKALNKITAKIIGSNANVATLLELGITPSVRNKLERLKSEIAKSEKEVEYLTSIVSKSTSNLTNRQEEIKTKVISERIRKKFELEKLKNEFYEIERKIDNNSEASVNVMEAIYPGTKIIIKTKSFAVNSQYTYTKYKLIDEEIVSMPYNEK